MHNPPGCTYEIKNKEPPFKGRLRNTFFYFVNLTESILLAGSVITAEFPSLLKVTASVTAFALEVDRMAVALVAANPEGNFIMSVPALTPPPPLVFVGVNITRLIELPSGL
jgi:hypothetical protein